jgi:hypothetical protein
MPLNDAISTTCGGIVPLSDVSYKDRISRDPFIVDKAEGTVPLRSGMLCKYNLESLGLFVKPTGIVPYIPVQPEVDM